MVRLFGWEYYGDAGGDASAGGEGGGEGHLAGVGGFDEVVEDLVGEGFVEYAFVAVGLEVEFEGFEFEAFLVGAVLDGDGAEIGLAGLGTEAGELRAVDFDLVVPLGGGVVKRF